MSERSRLAQIIAHATDATGHVDRAKVYEGLQLTPEAPETLLLDVFLSTDDALRTWRADTSKFENDLIAATRSAAAREAERLQQHASNLARSANAMADRVIRIAFLCGCAAGCAAAVSVVAVLRSWFGDFAP